MKTVKITNEAYDLLSNIDECKATAVEKAVKSYVKPTGSGDLTFEQVKTAVKESITELRY